MRAAVPAQDNAAAAAQSEDTAILSYSTDLEIEDGQGKFNTTFTFSNAGCVQFQLT